MTALSVQMALGVPFFSFPFARLPSEPSRARKRNQHGWLPN